MKRLQSELLRLAFAGSGEQNEEDRTRAFTLSLAGPGAWDSLGAAWRGVQADLGLPAPAIAVAGSAGYQLWFAVAEPIAMEQARALAQGVARRYLADAARARIATGRLGDPPPCEFAPGCWSAFVAPDLGGLFTEETWLDLQPGRRRAGRPARAGAADRDRGPAARAAPALACAVDDVGQLARGPIEQRSAPVPALGDERRDCAAGTAHRSGEGLAASLLIAPGRAMPRRSMDTRPHKRPGFCETRVP